MVNRSVRFYFARDGHVIVEVFNLPVSEHSSVGWSNFLHFCLATFVEFKLKKHNVYICIIQVEQSQKLGFPVNWKVVSEKKIFYDLQTINVQNIQFQTIQTIMKTD